jgi:hypothetical protein
MTFAGLRILQKISLSSSEEREIAFAAVMVKR